LIGAIRDCEEAIRVEPGYIKGYVRAAHCYFQLGQFAVAEKHFLNALRIADEAVSKDPNEAPKLASVKKLANEGIQNVELVRKEIKWCEEKLEKDPEQALKHANTALTYAPHSALTKLLQAKALIKLKKFPEVSKAMRNVKGTCACQFVD
jgi:tetratricopeptide (TPR) repeat protein